MDKILITSEALADFADISKPALITISTDLVVFNRPASKILAIDENSAFTFIIDGDKLFYKDHANGFKSIFRAKVWVSHPSHILPFLKSKLPLNSAAKSIKFEIGEFKEGLRLLTPIK